jgi:putative transposase
MSRLERAFQNYRRDRNVGQPHFKRKDRYNSITYPQYYHSHGSFSIKENKLKLSLVDGLIQVKMHRILIGNIKTCTIIRDIDRWFACFSYDNNISKNPNLKTNNIVGIDVGLLNWMTLSTGEVIDRPKFLSKSLEKIDCKEYLQERRKGLDMMMLMLITIMAMIIMTTMVMIVVPIVP